MSESVLISIFSADAGEKKTLAEALSSSNILFNFAANIHDLKENLYTQPCNGILFSIASLIGLDHGGKTFLQTLEQVFPVARIRWNRAKGTFALISSRSGRMETIAAFLAICAHFPPRCLRKSDRLSTILNTLISPTPDLAESDQTFMTNFSQHGCFIHTSREWNAGDAVFIQIQELADKKAIEGKVIRYVPWGTPFRIQGIGVQFTKLDEEQDKELKRLYSFNSD